MMQCIIETRVVLCNSSHHLTPLSIIAACMHLCIQACMLLRLAEDAGD